MDVMYEKEKIELPLSLKQGDRLYVHSAGAYTASYASVAFNGFPPIQTVFLPQ
jgi:ornithine decarboxylase